jgi:hypothetical protein
MCTYNLLLDDQLVAEAESTLSSAELPFRLWLQQQVEDLLRKQVSGRRRRVRSHANGLSDEELTELLAKYQPLSDADFPELSAADYANYARKSSGRLTKGLEKWL